MSISLTPVRSRAARIHLEHSAVGQGVVRLSGQVLGDGPQAHPLIAALGGDLDLIHRVGVGQSQIGQGKKLAHKRDLLILWGVRRLFDCWKGNAPLRPRSDQRTAKRHSV